MACRVPVLMSFAGCRGMREIFQAEHDPGMTRFVVKSAALLLGPASELARFHGSMVTSCGYSVKSLVAIGREPTIRQRQDSGNAVGFGVVLTEVQGTKRNGAGDGIRTRDIDLGKVALYQLSYSRPWGNTILPQNRNCVKRCGDNDENKLLIKLLDRDFAVLDYCLGWRNGGTGRLGWPARHSAGKCVFSRASTNSRSFWKRLWKTCECSVYNDECLGSNTELSST
jgi:hypothetical protein